MQTYDNLKLSGLFAPVVLYDIRIDQKYNDHAYIWLSGMLPDGIRDQYTMQMLESEGVHLLLKSDDEKSDETQPIFHGLTAKVEITQRGNVYWIEVNGISHSYLLDIKKENCSFQDIEKTYDQVIQNRMDGIKGQYINEDIQKDEAIDRFTLQWNETRWMFIKRLISRHHQGLIPDIYVDELAYWIGLPRGRRPHTIINGSFESVRDIQNGMVHLENAAILNADINDFFCYRLLNRHEYFRLGDKIEFQGLTWVIIEIHSRLDHKNGILVHDYTITTENGCKQPTFYNDQIRGMSLEGMVIDRRKDFSKIHLYQIDEQQDIEFASWFRQPAFYTAGTDSGWCAMPELGDQMSLHFPSREENDCYLLDSTMVPYKSSIFQNVNTVSKSGMRPYSSASGEDKTDRTIVNSKFIVAPNEQSMLLEDDMIHFSAKGSASTLSLYTSHDDETGKTLGIRLNAENDMEMISKNLSIGDTTITDTAPTKNIEMKSLQNVVLSCADSSIVLDHETGMADTYATSVYVTLPDSE